MVNKIIILSIILSCCFGCCYTGKRTIYGLPRRNIKTIKNSTTNNSIIDTNALYKAEIDFHYNTSLNEYSYYDRVDDNKYPYVGYHKFYSNGKLGLFIIPKKDTANLKREYFNPLRAKMGYYSIIDSSIITRISTIGDCSLYISNKSGVIKGDTLILQNKRHHGTISIKRKVNRSLLEGWKPDW